MRHGRIPQRRRSRSSIVENIATSPKPTHQKDDDACGTFDLPSEIGRSDPWTPLAAGAMNCRKRASGRSSCCEVSPGGAITNGKERTCCPSSNSATLLGARRRGIRDGVMHFTQQTFDRYSRSSANSRGSHRRRRTRQTTRRAKREGSAASPLLGRKRIDWGSGLRTGPV